MINVRSRLQKIEDNLNKRRGEQFGWSTIVKMWRWIYSFPPEPGEKIEPKKKEWLITTEEWQWYYNNELRLAKMRHEDIEKAKQELEKDFEDIKAKGGFLNST